MNATRSPTSLLALCLFSLPVWTRAAMAEGVQPVTVDDPRPVAAAIEKLESVYGIPITYEDTLYVYEGETKDVTARRVLVPKGGVLSFSYVPPPDGADVATRMSLAEDAIRAMLKRYHPERDAGAFSFAKAEHRFHVFATRFVNASGQEQALPPLLDAPISFAPVGPNAGAILNQWAAAVNAATPEPASAPRFPAVWLGNVPVNLLMQTRCTLSASSEPARSVLVRLIQQLPVFVSSEEGPGRQVNSIPAALSWQLLCDPQAGCALNLHLVQPLPWELRFRPPPTPPVVELDLYKP
jgi:hypothetical protein